MSVNAVLSLDKNQMTISQPSGPQIKSSVAWHFIAALYLRFNETPHTQGELSLSELQKFPFFARYERDSLRVSIARAITTIEHHFTLVDYDKKSTGPWRLTPAAAIEIQPSLRELQAKLQYNTSFTQQLTFEDEQELLQFARYIVDGDCLLHTGNQLDAALSCYYSATLFSNQLLNSTAKLRFTAALIRLGDFAQAKQTIAQTDWGPRNSYAGVHARFLQYRLNRLAGDEPTPLISAETISLPDDITRALALTLNAFAKRDYAVQKAKEGSSKAVIKHLTQDCIADLLNAIFLRLRASHYDNIQQSAFNLANAIYILSDMPNSPFQWPEIADQIFKWCDLCDTVCDTFEVGQDTHLNNLLRAETLARNPDTAHLALPAAQDALAKSRNNGNLYDQLELSSLIERLQNSARQKPSH